MKSKKLFSKLVQIKDEIIKQIPLASNRYDQFETANHDSDFDEVAKKHHEHEEQYARIRTEYFVFNHLKERFKEFLVEHNINSQDIEKITQQSLFKEQFKKYLFNKMSILFEKIERSKKYLGFFTDNEEIKQYLHNHVDELIEKLCFGQELSLSHQDFATRLEKDNHLIEHRELCTKHYNNVDPNSMFRIHEKKIKEIKKTNAFLRGIYFERVNTNVGYCDEFTTLALLKIFRQRLVTEHITVEKVNISYLDDDRKSMGGHTFLAVNRDPKSLLDDIPNWGNDAILVDPWNKLVCYAKDLESQPLHYFSFPRSIIFEGEIHCAKWETCKYTSKDYSLLEKLSRSDMYYTMTGNNNIVDREKSIIEEHELIPLTSPQFTNIKKFLDSLLVTVLPNNFTQHVELYITLGGQSFVRLISGLSQATIAIHKDFLCNIKHGKYTLEELKFGLATALYQIKYNPLNSESSENQCQIDELAVEKCRNGAAAVSYLQKSILFAKEHVDHPEIDEMSFNLADTSNVNPGVRIKNIQAKLADQNKVNYTEPTFYYSEEVSFKELDTIEPIAFFNTNIYKSYDCTVKKINYLKSRLEELKIEFYPYEVTQQPSVRLREFCRLLRKLKVDLSIAEQAFAIDELINAAFNLEIPGFERIYRAVLNETCKISKSIRNLIPLGFMKNYQQAMDAFVYANNFEQTKITAQDLLKSHADLKNHFMYNSSMGLLDKKKLAESGKRFFCSSIGSEIAWKTFPWVDIISKAKVDYLQNPNNIKPNSYIFINEPKQYELYYINSNKEIIKLDINTIPDLPSVLAQSNEFNIASEVYRAIRSHLLKLREGVLPWNDHLNWADQDESNTIASALLHAGVVRDERLWQYFTVDQINQKIKMPEIYNDEKSSKYNDQYLPPLVKLGGDLNIYGDDYYYTATRVETSYFYSKKHKLQTYMFNEVKNFEDAFCQFYDKNLPGLSHPRYCNSDSPTANFLLNKFTEVVLHGTDDEKKVVKSFFLGRNDKRDLRHLQRFGSSGTDNLEDSSLYVQFFIYQRYKNINFKLFNLKETLKLFRTISFDWDKLPSDYFIDLYNFPKNSNFDLDSLRRLVSCLKEIGLVMEAVPVYRVVQYYLFHHGSFKFFSKETAHLLSFLLNDLVNPKFLLSRTAIFYRITDNSLNDSVESRHLSCDELITIYRAHDLYLKFKSYNQQSHLGAIILKKIIDLSSDEQIQMTEKLFLVSNKLYSSPLNDVQFRNELVAIWVRNIVNKFGKDTNSNQYFAEMMVIINRIHANTHSRDVAYILSQLANAILAQNKLSEHIGMLLEPEKYTVNDQELETIFNSQRSKSRTKETLLSVVRLLGKVKDDRMELLEFLSSPLSEQSLKHFASYLIKRDQATNLIGIILPKNVNAYHGESLECVLQLIYNMFWNCSLQHRAVVVDYLLIPADDVTNEEVNKTSYEEAFLYVANKLFPNTKIDENENFAVAFLKAYLDVTDKFMRTYLLAAMLVTSNATHNAKTRVGQKLVTLCEHLGPAYVKLAQAIHSYPDTPEDIREDLAGVKGRANPPTRWQLWRLINEVLIDDKDQIAYLGAVLGSASFNIAVEVHLKNNTDAVLLLLRENAKKDADVGFNQLHKTVEICQHQKMNSIREISMSLIDEAKDLSVLEMDRKAGDLQSEIAARIYHSLLEVKINNVNYNIVCFSSKTISSGEGYRFIERVYGTEYNDLPVLNSQDYALKKAIAKAVVSIELINILSGSFFDCDRHGNQLRVYVDHHTHTIQLGLYDFGEMAIKEPNMHEIKQLDKFIAMIPNLFFHQKPMAVTFSNYISEVKKEGHPTEYLMKIRKALLAIQDFQKYLTNDEVVEILKFIGYKNAVHPAINSSYMTTLSRVGAMHFVFKVGQEFRNYVSSVKNSTSTFFSTKIFLQIGKRKHIDEVEDNSLELPELKKSKKNIDPIILDMSKVHVSPILSWNPNHAVIQFKP